MISERAAISQQTRANSRRTPRDNGLSFPILSDGGGEVGAAFGRRRVMPEDVREVHKRLGSAAAIVTFEQTTLSER
jgi:peroxiredoxin